MSDIGPALETVTGIQLAMMRATNPQIRGQHFKMHGCIDAAFEVPPDVPDALRIGLFAAPATYRAVVRFSNGAQQDDRVPDIHGMAIKVIGVAGPRALVEAPEGEQDFVLADKPVFFIRTAADYALFMADFAQSAPRGQPPAKFIAYLQEHHPEDVPVLVGFRQQVQSSPLAATYWSQVPYAFGPEPAIAARYRAVPRAPADAAPGDSHDYLRERMAARLADAAEPVVFDFQIQLRLDADAAVLDNPTVEWDAPFVTVATVTIPPQAFDTGERVRAGEAMRFSPWHALEAHRPRGQINEIRRTVYLASQAERSRAAALGQQNLRLTDEELRRDIDDDFKAVLDRLTRTFTFLSHAKSGRGTHTYGVAGRGTARFIVSPRFPANDFFTFGRELPVILRHSSPGARADDRARDGVAASLKFLDGTGGRGGPGVLDVLMNAGRQLFVRSIRDFSTFVHASDDERRQLVADGIMLEPELIEAYRIRGSFLDSRYHSWQCFEFFDASGVRAYIRFRLIPGDRGPERGLPRPDFRADGAPSMDPEPDDPRAPDFLRQEWIHQVLRSTVTYVFQGQIHPEPADMHPNHEVLNPARAWNELHHPWHDLCAITIDEPILDNDVVSALDVTPNRSPPCLRIPLATSPDQYASLGHARALVYPVARAVREAASRPQNN